MRRCLLLTVLLFSLSAFQTPRPESGERRGGMRVDGPSAPLKQAWVAQSEGNDSFTTWPVVAQQRVFASMGSGLVAVEPRSGQIVWEKEYPEGQKQVAPTVYDDRLIIQLPKATVISADMETGGEKWRFVGEGYFEYSGAVANGRFIFAGEDPHALYSLDAETGAEIWRQSLPERPLSVPLISHESIFVLTLDLPGSKAAHLRRLDFQSGSEIWSREVRGNFSSPTVLDDTIVFGNGDFSVWAVDIATGETVWRSPTVGRFGAWAIPVVRFGDVFIIDETGQIYRIDGRTGKRKWMFEDTVGHFLQSSPVIAGRTVFAGSGAGHLYALDTETGRLLWKGEVDGSVLSGAVDEERWYFGVKNGEEGLYAYEHDPKGRLEPQYKIPGYLMQLGLAVLLFVSLAFAIVRISRRSRERG